MGLLEPREDAEMVTAETVAYAPQGSRCLFCKGPLPSEKVNPSEVMKMEGWTALPSKRVRVEYAHPACWTEEVAKSDKR